MTTTVQAIRQKLGMTQVEMAGSLGLSPRAYQDIEAGVSKERPAHIMAAERVALEQAVKRGDPMLAPEQVRRLALELSRLLIG